MATSKKVFTTVFFHSATKSFDYPQNAPLPLIGHRVSFNDNSGIVKEVRHSVRGEIADVLIICK
jgi:hypothetical protein